MADEAAHIWSAAEFLPADGGDSHRADDLEAAEPACAGTDAERGLTAR